MPIQKIYGCFCTVVTELSSCNRNHVAHKASDIYQVTLYRKNLLTPASLSSGFQLAGN